MEYSPSAGFYKTRDTEDYRHYATRLALLMNQHGLKAKEANVLLSSIDVFIAQEWDQEPFSKSHYTWKADLLTKELLDEPTPNIRKALKTSKFLNP